MTILVIVTYFVITFAGIYADEFCQTEFFQPQCPKNDVILMKNATYGRMNVGRCVTAEEVDAYRAVSGDQSRYFRCSVNVLDLLDQRCSGKMNCEVRVVDILKNTTSPCFPGLVVYLEASYDCITAVDDKRSCAIKAQIDAVHIISSSPNGNICGTKTQPWIVESPVGQKISVTLIDFSGKVKGDDNMQLCTSFGTIFDKMVNRNVSICGGKAQRQTQVYESKGNILEIYSGSSDFQESPNHGRRFMLKIEAVGCSEIVPPEDTWLKRKDDAVVIGCYSTRQTWQLSCNEGKWIGVLGNCSLKTNSDDSKGNDQTFQSETMPAISNQEQILAIVAISGCTFAVCLVIVCVGIICLRRFYVRYKDRQDYKVLSLHRNPDLNQHLIRGIPSDSVETEARDYNSKILPTYSVYDGDNASILITGGKQ